MKFEDVRKGYGNLWQMAEVEADRRPVVRRVAEELIGYRSRYEAVATSTGVPWFWIAVIHQRESGANFARHLHNGDPLTARTTRVPAGRPTSGSPPFSWEFSAVDAILYKGLDKIKDWAIERVLYEAERYNGFGYVSKGINSPYIWSFTTLYDKGKYVADHKFDPNAVDKQIGVAAILKVLVEMGEVDFKSKGDPMTELTKQLEDYEAVAPGLVAVAQVKPQLALRVLSEAANGKVDKSDPEAMTQHLAGLGFSGLVVLLQTAEALVSKIVPQAQEPVAVDAPPAPVPSPTAPEVLTPLDKILGGEKLAGWKTYIGLAILLVAGGAEIMFPGGVSILTPAILSAMQWLGGILAGAAAVSKAERWLKWFKELKEGKQ